MEFILPCILIICFGISTATPWTFNRSCLADRLSPQATISGPNSAPRWSEYDAPAPLAVVNVANERDVLLMVRCDGRHHGRSSAC